MEETAFIRKARSSQPTSAPPDKTSDFSRQLVYLKFKKGKKVFKTMLPSEVINSLASVYCYCLSAELNGEEEQVVEVLSG